jgi:hypothetical protein
MKNRSLKISALIIFVLVGINGVSAQNTKSIIKMKMAEMEKSPRHLMTMAYRNNLKKFSETLRDITKDGKSAEVESARKALSEIKRSMEKTEEFHLLHMQTMTAEMNEIMFPMMEKMYAENALIKEHITALEKALKADTPDMSEVNKHAAEIVLTLGMKKMKMKM